jgi:hypothetical protein
MAVFGKTSNLNSFTVHLVCRKKTEYWATEMYFVNADHVEHDLSLWVWILFLLLQGKWQTTVHLSGCFHVPKRLRQTTKKQYRMHRLLTIGLKMCELRCWGCGAADEGCWWLAAPVGGVAGFCWRSSLGGGGSGRDGGWGSGTTKCKVADKKLHNTVKPRFYIPAFCVFYNFMCFLYCPGQMPIRTSFPDFMPF